jgi:hypothetical protein
MFKAVILFIVLVAVALTLIFQVIVPLFVKELPLFWWFKRFSPKEEHQLSPTDLTDLEKEVDSVMKTYTDVTEKVDSALEKTQSLKEKTKTANQ